MPHPAAASAAAHSARRARLIAEPGLHAGLARRGRRFLLLMLAAAAVPIAGTAAAQVATETPSSPIAQAIRGAVGGKLREFYRTRGYWPLWIVDGVPAPQAAALVDVIESTGIDGLEPSRYSPERLRRLIDEAQGGDARANAYLEVALSGALADLVRDMREPHVEIRYLEPGLTPKRAKPDEILRRAALAKSTLTYVRTLGWMNPLYVRLRGALEEAGPGEGGEPIEIADGPLLRPGDIGERVSALRLRLGLPDGEDFNDALAARVRRFQAARGLPADGIVGTRTIAALNGFAQSGTDRSAVLRLNLERARLLPDAWTRHIVVDAAAARLWYYGAGAEQGAMRVVVGARETQTPMMAGMVRYATLNPYWNVPVDLVRKRIAPKMLAGGSLSAQGYEALSDWTNDAQVIDAKTIDWRAVAAGTVEPRVRELPGRGNSMGSVKFMFPNDDGIYLHDTPQRNLFAKPDRHFSNGCVRLEDAGRLGRWLFDRPLKPEGAKPEQHVALDDPVPVYLMYFTASPLDEGVQYVADAYGRDRPALQHLASR